MKRARLLLIIAMVLAASLRLFWLFKFPVGFTPDEASFGYDAYSILNTGKDQWGKTFPLVLESFGDYKPPLYSYLLTPFVGVFGLSKVAIRLPNAIFGTLAVYATYLLAGELGLLIKMNARKRKAFQLISTFLVSISSWHFMMSRGAFESTLTTFFLPFGTYLFLKGLKEPKKLVLSALVFGLNLFSYHSAKLVTPALLMILICLFWNELKKMKRSEILIPTGVIAIFLCFTIYTFTIGAGARVQERSVFAGALNTAAENRTTAILSGMNPTLARLIHNKYRVAGKLFANNYFQYYSPQFLFTQGPAEATYGMIPGRGVLYWFELPFLLGLLIILGRLKINRSLLILLAWLFLAPVPAALATGPGYAGNRAVIMIPAIQLLMALGALELYDIAKRRFSRELLRKIVAGYVVISAVLFIASLEDYFIQSPRKSAQAMLYGDLEAARWLKENVDDNRKIVISRSLSEPHIFIAFANTWNPKDYQEQTGDWDYSERGLAWVDQIPEYELGNYLFKNIDWPTDSKKDYVLVGRPEEFPSDVSPSKIITYPNGVSSIFIIDLEKGYYAQKGK